MPQLSELQQTASKDAFVARTCQNSEGGEKLVADARAMQRPPGMVEEKLSKLIRADFSRVLSVKPR
ncbi:MAG TPA: hypothetical protein PLY87_14235 [Planctomycetaceae bacterium]|nr:hypothetical protein [Planctomycetaceae bacterium]HQZ66242.1 hypothetical protein [Planctomycetaceae bacterium]